jgi:hypothetical protein
MKELICTGVFIALQLLLPWAFHCNGLGVTTWQWWALSGGILISNVVGYIEGRISK